MRCAVLTFFTLSTLCFSFVSFSNCEAVQLDLLSDRVDWQAQDYPGNESIRSVKLNMEEKRLELSTHFIGGDNHYSAGEVYLDFRYLQGLGGKFLDFSDTGIYVSLEVPGGTYAKKFKFGSVQVFVKDNQGLSQYGTWTNISTVEKCGAFLSPKIGQVELGYTDEGFNPSKIKIIGVKFEIEEGLMYDGKIYIKEIKIEPSINLKALLPASVLPPKLTRKGYIELKTDGLYVDGKKQFVVGGNWQIIDYGQNFGATAWYPSGNGVSKHPNFVRINLGYFKRAGITLVRVGLLSDGRTMFDKAGNVSGYNKVFRADVKTFLDIAQEMGIKVEFTLLDYLIAGRGEGADDVWMRGREKIITDEKLRKDYLKFFLVPFLKEFGSSTALFGFDIINSPGWMVSKGDGGMWEDMDDWSVKPDNPVPLKSMKDFISDCVDVIRTHARGKLVTVGLSSPCISLVKDVDIDYISLNHYPWMGELSEYVNLIPSGIPWMLQEYPANASLKVCFDTTLALGGMGAIIWSLSPAIDGYTFSYETQSKKLLEIRSWLDAPHEVQKELKKVAKDVSKVPNKEERHLFVWGGIILLGLLVIWKKREEVEKKG